MSTPTAIMALKGVLSGLGDGFSAALEVELLGSGFVRSVREAEERRSVTAEAAVDGTFEA